MPEYLSPGVYVEETSFRSKSIEGVSTTTTGFVGPCRYGPVDLENELVTSLNDFEAQYGDRQQLVVGTDAMHNYLWHAVRAFFNEGGKRLYVSRVFRRLDDKKSTEPDEGATLNNNLYDDGFARAAIVPALTVRARYPGAAGNFRIRLTLRLGMNVLSRRDDKTQVTGALRERDVAVVRRVDGAAPDLTGAYLVLRDPATLAWQFTSDVSDPTKTIAADKFAGHELRVVTAAVTVTMGEITRVWDGLALDPQHTQNGAEDSLTSRFAWDRNNPTKNRGEPLVIVAADTITNGLDLLRAIAPAASPLWVNLIKETATEAERSMQEVALAGGNDGKRPGADQYRGAVNPDTMRRTGLAQFEDLEDISIVAAPGSTFGLERDFADDAASIVNHLITHAHKMHYRIAILDSGDAQSVTRIRAMRARIDSTHAALYYPWVKVLDPVTRAPIFLPPSGFVAGIYARNDTNRAVYKAPANEVVNLALGFEILLNGSQQDVLNPEGINAFRFFEGRGYRLWGARTVSSDPEWKYVNIRRYFAYLGRSIDKGTQWAVFEPNGEQLWANVRRTIEDFLLNEWQSGALLGDKPEKAYFVRCDRSTMTQNDLDNGRLICQIGVAPLKPAEFVIFRIGQWTADRKS